MKKVIFDQNDRTFTHCPLKVKSLSHKRSEKRVGEWTVTQVKQRKGWRMSFDVGKATGWRMSCDGKVGEWAELIDIEIYSRAHSPTFPSLHQRHSSFCTPPVALPTSQLILQPFRCFTNVTAYSPTPSFASPASQALQFRHLASRPCYECSSIVLCARTRKVFTILPIPAVAFKETANSPSPPYSLQICSRVDSVNS